MSLAELTELIFPSRCIGCRALGLSLCSRCRRYWNPHIYRRAVSGLMIYSAIEYSPIAQKVVLGAKESGYRICDDLIVEALKYSLKYFSREIGNATLVPIPSKQSAQRKRGRDFIAAMTSQIDAANQSALRVSKRVRDQSQLSVDQRARNVQGAFEVISVPIGDVILIDDIVTSGATLLEARRAFARRGVRVKGAITAVMA